jgi:hypothetical protein
MDKNAYMLARLKDLATCSSFIVRETFVEHRRGNRPDGIYTLLERKRSAHELPFVVCWFNSETPGLHETEAFDSLMLAQAELGQRVGIDQRLAA